MPSLLCCKDSDNSISRLHAALHDLVNSASDSVQTNDGHAAVHLSSNVDKENDKDVWRRRIQRFSLAAQAFERCTNDARTNSNSCSCTDDVDDGHDATCSEVDNGSCSVMTMVVTLPPPTTFLVMKSVTVANEVLLRKDENYELVETVVRFLYHLFQCIEEDVALSCLAVSNDLIDNLIERVLKIDDGVTVQAILDDDVNISIDCSDGQKDNTCISILSSKWKVMGFEAVSSIMINCLYLAKRYTKYEYSPAVSFEDDVGNIREEDALISETALEYVGNISRVVYCASNDKLLEVPAINKKSLFQLSAMMLILILNSSYKKMVISNKEQYSCAESRSREIIAHTQDNMKSSETTSGLQVFAFGVFVSLQEVNQFLSYSQPTDKELGDKSWIKQCLRFYFSKVGNASNNNCNITSRSSSLLLQSYCSSQYITSFMNGNESNFIVDFIDLYWACIMSSNFKDLAKQSFYLAAVLENTLILHFHFRFKTRKCFAQVIDTLHNHQSKSDNYLVLALTYFVNNHEIRGTTFDLRRSILGNMNHVNLESMLKYIINFCVGYSRNDISAKKMENNVTINGIEKSTDDSILIEKEFACCRCAARCCSDLDLMVVLCECDDEIIKKFLESVTEDTIISTCKILTSHFSIKLLSLPNQINARTNLGISAKLSVARFMLSIVNHKASQNYHTRAMTCKQDVLKQNLFPALENNLNESETGNFNLQSLISFSVNNCISFDITRRAYDVIKISHDDSFIENLFSYNKKQIDWGVEISSKVREYESKVQTLKNQIISLRLIGRRAVEEKQVEISRAKRKVKSETLDVLRDLEHQNECTKSELSRTKEELLQIQKELENSLKRNSESECKQNQLQKALEEEECARKSLGEDLACITDRFNHTRNKLEEEIESKQTSLLHAQNAVQRLESKNNELKQKCEFEEESKTLMKTKIKEDETTLNDLKRDISRKEVELDSFSKAKLQLERKVEDTFAKMIILAGAYEEKEEEIAKIQDKTKSSMVTASSKMGKLEAENEFLKKKIAVLQRKSKPLPERRDVNSLRERPRIENRNNIMRDMDTSKVYKGRKTSRCEIGSKGIRKSNFKGISYLNSLGGELLDREDDSSNQRSANSFRTRRRSKNILSVRKEIEKQRNNLSKMSTTDSCEDNDHDGFLDESSLLI